MHTRSREAMQTSFFTTPGEGKDVDTSGAPIEVVVTRLAAAPEAVRASAGLLSDAERHRARRFAFNRDASRFIVARARLRQLLAARLGVRAQAVEFEYGAYGKPVLSRRFADSDLRFNVSHCDDVAAYANRRESTGLPYAPYSNS